MNIDHLNKVQKEGGDHPGARPWPATRVCPDCGAARYSTGQDENGDFQFDGFCVACVARRIFKETPQERETRLRSMWPNTYEKIEGGV